MSHGQEALVDLTSGGLRELLDLLLRSDIAELELEVSGTRLFLKRSAEEQLSEAVPAPVGGATPSEADGAGFVVADRVGFFHFSADRPTAPPRPGEQVALGQVLGVIESLSMPSPVQAPHAGRLDQVLIEDGQPVEFGQPLFIIAPGEDQESALGDLGG